MWSKWLRYVLDMIDDSWLTNGGIHISPTGCLLWENSSWRAVFTAASSNVILRQKTKQNVPSSYSNYVLWITNTSLVINSIPSFLKTISSSTLLSLIVIFLWFPCQVHFLWLFTYLFILIDKLIPYVSFIRNFKAIKKLKTLSVLCLG
jgi:hypothetical protein